MPIKETYQPEWISADEACKWLNVDHVTLFKWRESKGLAWTNLGHKKVFYDRKQINELLNNNSTYAFSGVIKKTA